MGERFFARDMLAQFERLSWDAVHEMKRRRRKST